MCVKLPPGDLNPSPYSPHPMSIYICGVTTIPRMRSSKAVEISKSKGKCKTNYYFFYISKKIFFFKKTKF